MTTEQLPDEVLVLVLRHLEARDLLTCRLVCKRLCGLALDPVLWRHQTLRDDRRWACPVLRLAPCLRHLHLGRSRACHREATTKTKCAVAELSFDVRRAQGFERAARVIANQAALGRLKGVAITLGVWEPPFDMFSPHLVGHQQALTGLFQTAVSTPGLLDLAVRMEPGREYRDVYLAGARVPPSLQRFHCRGDAESFEPLGFEDCVLAAHAATLEEVNIGGPVSASTAALLAGMPRLRKLACCVLPGMQQLSACALTDLHLAMPTPPRAADKPGLEAFFGEARHLRALAVDTNCGSKGYGAELVLRLASSGRSRVERLALGLVGLVYGNQAADTQQSQALERALPMLPCLRRLEMASVSDALLQAITPESMPALRCLVVTASKKVRCTHAWLHREPVAALLVANPQLHVDVSVNATCYSWAFCAMCLQQCHKNVKDKRRAGFFSHDPAEKCTTPEHRCSDAPALSWYYVPPQREVIG